MLIPLIDFIEGFRSLGAEIIALRRLTPYVGSSIIATAPTIGFFPFALAVGYARHFVAHTEQRFDAVVVDVYGDLAIPSHLLTQEFWQASRRVLQPEGVLMANLILDSRLASPYARHVLDTLESV